MNSVVIAMLFCAGLLLAWGIPPGASPCTGMSCFTLYASPGNDCLGDDKAWFDVGLVECANRCYNDDQCVGFVYSTNPVTPHDCWHKFRLCANPQPLANTVTYMRRGEIPGLPNDNVPGYTPMASGGHDCPLKDIRSYDVTLSQCATLCDQNSRCVGFVYTTNRIPGHPCWLKYELCTSPLHMAVTEVFVKNNPTAGTGVPSGFETYGNSGEDCPGNDISSHHVGLEECANICSRNPNCVGFVYTTNNIAPAPCWPKWRLCSRTTPLANTAVYRRRRNIQVVPISNLPYPYRVVINGADCPGNDIASYHVSSVGQCANWCNVNIGCVGFVYTTNPQAHAPCWLKSRLCQPPLPMDSTVVIRKQPIIRPAIGGSG